MAIIRTPPQAIRGIVTCVPPRRFDNLTEATAFPQDEVEKVVRMAGVKTRHVATDAICSTDLCVAAAKRLLTRLEWDPSSVDALIFVTQTPDYFLPSSCCVVHHALGLSDACASFDVGLGCSGYPYGMWLASSMLSNPGVRRVLLLHGETPTRFAHSTDRAVALLFGDAGSATAIEVDPGSGRPDWWFAMHTDGTGLRDLMIPGGGYRERFPADPLRHFVSMDGANVFAFTIKRIPAVIEETLTASGVALDDVDYFILHQSNQFIMKHLMKKAQLKDSKVPMVIGEFGSAGGPSVPLAITRGRLQRPADRALRLLQVGYGVGLSWGSALVDLAPEAVLDHLVLDAPGVATEAGPA